LDTKFSSYASGQTDRQIDRQTSQMARCVTFAVARIRVKGLPFGH